MKTLILTLFAAAAAVSGTAVAKSESSLGATKFEFDGGFAIVQPNGSANVVYDSEETRQHYHNSAFNGQNSHFVAQSASSEYGVTSSGNVVYLMGEDRQIFVSNDRLTYGEVTVKAHCNFNAQMLHCIEIANDGSQVQVTHDRLPL